MKRVTAMLVLLGGLVGVQAAAHQTSQGYSNSDFAVIPTAEVLDPFGADTSMLAQQYELSSFHQARLSLLSTEIPGRYANLAGSLEGDPVVSNPTFILHVIQDDPETPNDESDLYSQYYLNTNVGIDVGPNTVRADSDVTVMGQGVAISTFDAHTITGEASG